MLPRLTTALVSVSLLAAMLPAPATAATALVRREAKSSSYGTAALMSRRHFSPGVSVVYVVGTAGLAHALIAGPAAAKRGGPVLVVKKGSIPTSVRRALGRLDPHSIIVVGGTNYVSGTVLRALGRYTTGTVRRQAASDVYDTSALVSRRRFASGVPIAYIANGSTGLAEAMAGGAAAATLHGPLLYVHRGRIPASVRTELNRLNPLTIRVLGTSAHVSARVMNRLDGYTAGVVRREAGTSLYKTSSIVSRLHFSPGVAAAYVVGVNGVQQAMAVDAAAGKLHAPVLFVSTNTITGRVRRELERLDPAQILVAGTSATVSGSVVTDLAAYVKRPPVAANDSLGTLVSGCPGTSAVLQNDTDANDPNDSLKVSAASDPAHGSTTILTTLLHGISRPRAVEYVSDGGYTGADSFTYTVTDPHGDSDQGSVSVNVAASGGNSDGDSLPNECDPFPQDATNNSGASLPFNLAFNGGDGGLADSGFTGLMTNSRLGSLLDGDVHVSGGALLNPTVDGGDANNSFNSQRNALQANLDTPSSTFRVDGSVCGPFPTEVGAGVGIYFGTGDQDNFVKAIVTWNARRGTYAMQDYREVNGTGAGVAKKSDSNLGSANCVTIYLTVNPATGMYSPSYSIDGGPRMGFGGDSTRRTVPAGWLSSPTIAAGIIATSRGAAPPFQATWSGFHVVVP
jgi:putative cell wall-binding protein